jgi:hypothetical protein
MRVDHFMIYAHFQVKALQELPTDKHNYFEDPPPTSGRKPQFFANCAHLFKIRSSVPIMLAGLMIVACEWMQLIHTKCIDYRKVLY